MQDIRQQMTIAIRWLPLILVVALAAGGIAFVYASSQGEVYEARGALRVEVGPEATSQDYGVAREALEQYSLDAGSRNFLQAITAGLGIDESFEDFQERVTLTTDGQDLTLEISPQAGDPQEARLIALRIGNELRRRVNSSLITDLVRETENTIRANSRLIDTYNKRLNTLIAKQRKTDGDRSEMVSLSLLVSGLRAENLRLEQSSRDWVRNRLVWSERPRLPDTSSSQPVYWALLALVAGGMLGAALAFVLEYLRHGDRVNDTRDLEKATGLPALGAVSVKRGDIRRGPTERLVMLRYPTSEAAEAYRGLLTKIGFAAGSARSLMVASPDSSDISNTVAANIALAYADAGRTALLVDADYRSPRLHEMFGVANDRGLTDLLADRNVPLGFVTTPTPHPRLGLMPAGPPLSATAQALGTPVLNALLRRLLHAADVVVFASPSIAANLDSAVLASGVDEGVLVVEAGARVDDIVDAAAVLERARVHFTGAVLYRQVRGAYPGRAAVTLKPPQVQWVPRADPVPDEPRLTAVAGQAPVQGAPPEARTGGVQQPAAAGAPSHAPAQEGPAHPSTASRPPAVQTVPTAPVTPGSSNGHGTGGATIPRGHPTAARPQSAPPGQVPVSPQRAGPRPTAAPGGDGRTSENFVAIAVGPGPYSAPFDPNLPKSTSPTSKS